jgi:hypothetical protein
MCDSPIELQYKPVWVSEYWDGREEVIELGYSKLLDPSDSQKQ